MAPVTTGQKIFFAVIFVAALLVAVLGIAAPAYLASIFTWLVLPPLHARFVGAIYAFGAFFMLGCLLARRQAEVRYAVQLIGCWTGMLFVISLLNLAAFDFTRLPVLIWFASYITYPIISIVMTLRNPPSQQTGDLPGPELSGWAKGFLLLQGGLFTLLALLLFFLPGLMTTLWPWKITLVLAQMYAGPLLAYGLGSLLFSRQEKWVGVRAIVPGMMIFTDVALIVSLLHYEVFAFGGLADILWFGWFAVATFILLVMAFMVVQLRE